MSDDPETDDVHDLGVLLTGAVADLILVHEVTIDGVGELSDKFQWILNPTMKVASWFYLSDKARFSQCS